MKKQWLWLSGVLIAALAACNSNSNPNPNPSLGPTCNTQGVTTQLVYPAPGSTGVLDSFGQVIVGSSPAPLPSSWDVVLVTAISPNGIAGGTFTTATPPFPTPNATPTVSNPQYQTSSFSGATFPGEVVNVYLNNTATNCTPAGPIGSFTTQ